MAKGAGERALDKVLDAARNDPGVIYVEASINPNGVEIGRVLMAVSRTGVEAQVAELDKRFAALIASAGQLVGESLQGASAESAKALQARLQSAESAAATMQANTHSTVQDAAAQLRWRIGLCLALVGLAMLVVLAAVLGRRVVHRLRLLVGALDDLAAGEGDLTKRVAIHSRDEIGDMAAAVNRFVDKLQPIVREAGEVAHKTGVEIGSMAQRNAGADDAAQLQRDEVAQSLQDLSQMADEAQAESQAMQSALQQVVGDPSGHGRQHSGLATGRRLDRGVGRAGAERFQGDRTTGRAESADRGGVDGDPRDRRADQSAGAQCRHRSGASR